MNTLLTTLLWGLLIGFLATAVITITQLIEMKITGRPSSFTPAIIFSKLLGFNLKKIPHKSQVLLNYLVHFGYGSLWGLGVLLFSIKFLPLWSLAIVYFLLFWVVGLIMVPIFARVDPPWKWKISTLLLDAFFHVVYVVAALVFYLAL